MSNQLEATHWSCRQRGQAAETEVPPGFQNLTTSVKANTPLPPLSNPTATPAVHTLATPTNQSPIPPFTMSALPMPGNPYYLNANPAYHHNGTSSVPNYHAMPVHHPSTQSYFTQPLQQSAPMFDHS